MSAVHFAFGLLALLVCMGKAGRATNWPTQLGWVVIGLTAMALELAVIVELAR